MMLHLPITHVKINMIVFSNSLGFQNDIYVGQLLSFTKTIAQLLVFGLSSNAYGVIHIMCVPSNLHCMPYCAKHCDCTALLM